MLDALEYIGKI
ncbi:protein of unknown function [Magnetospirillum gryphiswaldense MSR-1 v2]|uniref:Uncharacterized protein n=1 Tax=Magnetospirillum gryphiswaldense (strain DSM 6361 / JCM 21280 / NBRC 15271 / MSR-1) TaxID=431944 RepID=V6EYM2_MAGGM|nr:protein of unknown function [Magnetospirillum gryphiswaldense MSR-1 v2]